PERVLTNADLERLGETSRGWIRTRPGLRRPHIVEPGTPPSELAGPAAPMALEKRGRTAGALGPAIAATGTPDMNFPAPACVLPANGGAKEVWAFRPAAARPRSVDQLTMGPQLYQTGARRKGVVIGADVMSSIIDSKARATCVLFGDGAGAVLLEPATDDTGI